MVKGIPLSPDIIFLISNKEKLARRADRAQ